MKITLIFIGVYSKLNKTNVTRNVIKVRTFYRLEDINRKKPQLQTNNQNKKINAIIMGHKILDLTQEN